MPYKKKSNKIKIDKFITVTVITTGDDLIKQFNINEPVKVIFNNALQLVGGGSHADQFTLEFEDQILALDKKIAEYVTIYNWGSETTLELVPRPEVI